MVVDPGMAALDDLSAAVADYDIAEMVVAGLVMSAGKERAFSARTRVHIEGFWETLDEVLNILLLSLIHI